jgi:hypothetical protein
VQHWLFSRKTDLTVLFAPVWLCWLIAFMLPDHVLAAASPLWVWVLFVIGIDVGHVWSTLFRTYTDKEEFQNHRSLLLYTPVICFLVAYGISAISFSFFWRCLAYLAVYHFVKQQYGFTRIYKAKAKDFKPKFFNDNWIIYMSMLYPVFYWHMNLDRNFSWFIDGDFIQLSVSENVLFWMNTVGVALYLLILAGWLIEEVFIIKKFSIGKVLWVFTTAGNWFLGIVYFNSDLVFTITNVVAHGIPYLALVIFYQQKKERVLKRKRRIPLLATVIGGVLLLAFAEEYLWDMLVYRDNVTFFTSLINYPWFENVYPIQHVGLALLSVPQTTHYVLDGFIWKNNEKNPHLKTTLLK